MATAVQLVLDEQQTAGTDIVVAVTQNPGIVLLDTQKFDAFYDKLKAKAPTDVDVTSRKGREALRSFASDVRSEKAAIDKARLRLTKEWRDMTAQANAAGKVIEERLESLAVEVRQPLTEWEAAEKARAARVDAAILGMQEFAKVSIDDTSATVRERGTAVYSMALDTEEFGDRLDEAAAVKAASIATLKTALARLTQEEADRAELERLRAENEARAAREREEAEARELAERQAEEARIAEARRVAAEKAEAERMERIARGAEDRARRDAEAAAEAERAKVQREHEAALAAERDRAAAAERAAQAERDRIAAEERARAVEAERVAAEQAKREADQKHRAKVKTAAKEAIMTCGADEETARKIVTLIIAREVPNVRLEF